MAGKDFRAAFSNMNQAVRPGNEQPVVKKQKMSLVEEAIWSFQKNRSWEDFLTRLKPTVKDMMRRGITFSMEY